MVAIHAQWLAQRWRDISVEEFEFEPATFFMLAGLMLMLVIVFFQPGSRTLPIYRWINCWIDRFRVSSKTVDALFRGLVLLGSNWKFLVLAVLIWWPINKGLDVIIRTIVHAQTVDIEFPRWAPLVFMILTVWTTIILVFVVRTLMKGEWVSSSGRQPFLFHFAGAIFLIFLFVQIGMSYLQWPAQSLVWLVTSFHVSPNWVYSTPLVGYLLWGLALGFGITMLMIWVPQAIAGRHARFGRFVTASWPEGLRFVAIVLMLGLISAIAYEVERELFHLMVVNGLANGWSWWLNQIVSFIYDVQFIFFKFWAIGCLVVFSEAARTRITGS